MFLTTTTLPPTQPVINLLKIIKEYAPKPRQADSSTAQPIIASSQNCIQVLLPHVHAHRVPQDTPPIDHALISRHQSPKVGLCSGGHARTTTQNAENPHQDTRNIRDRSIGLLLSLSLSLVLKDKHCTTISPIRLSRAPLLPRRVNPWYPRTTPPPNTHESHRPPYL